jgi:hypothetical protein
LLGNSKGDLVVTFTLRQVTAVVDGNAYRVTNEVTAAVDASTATYVYRTDNQTFSHYASAADMAQWPDSLALAQLSGAGFYRLPCVVRTWDTISKMNADLVMSIRRLQSLADELNVGLAQLTLDRTLVIEGR